MSTPPAPTSNSGTGSAQPAFRPLLPPGAFATGTNTNTDAESNDDRTAVEASEDEEDYEEDYETEDEEDEDEESSDEILEDERNWNDLKRNADIINGEDEMRTIAISIDRASMLSPLLKDFAEGRIGLEDLPEGMVDYVAPEGIPMEEMCRVYVKDRIASITAQQVEAAMKKKVLALVRRELRAEEKEAAKRREQEVVAHETRLRELHREIVRLEAIADAQRRAA